MVRASSIQYLQAELLQFGYVWSCVNQCAVQSCANALQRFYAEPLGNIPSEEASVPDYKVVVGLCAAVSLICSIDRASISVAIVPMAEQYGWSDSVKGAISSSFFIGYTFTNLIGRYNPLSIIHRTLQYLCTKDLSIVLHPVPISSPRA